MQRVLFRRFCLLAFFSLLLVQDVRGASVDALKDAVEKADTLLEYLSPSKVMETLTFNITSCVKSMVSGFGICVAVILLSAVFSAFKESYSSYSYTFDIISGSVLTASCFYVLTACFETVQKSIASICAYMTSFVPVSTVLLASSGNTVTAGSGNVLNLLFIDVVQLVSVSLVLPCVKAIVVLYGVNSLCKKTNLGGIASFLKSTCLWITGLSFTVFTGILSLQTLLSSGADNLALKGIKYSTARLVPIAGGMLSESMKNVIASMNYIKTVTGIGAVVYILYSILLPVCAVLVTKMFFLILSALAKASNQDSAASMLDGLNGCVNILAAVLLGCSVAFIIMLAIFIKVTVSL